MRILGVNPPVQRRRYYRDNWILLLATYFRPALKSTSLGTEKDIFKVQLNVLIYSRHFPLQLSKFVVARKSFADDFIRS